MSELPAPLWLERRFQENKARKDDQRHPFQRDKARVLHSAAFRRLQAKTQVLGVGMNDFYRTRLTHSLEAAQIGTALNAQLRLKFPDIAPLLDDHLIETLCLAHDIGHPPFGHGGEVALNYMMRQHGGFEGNGQTFRILARLEPYTQHYGMNLTRRALLGVLKYPVCHSLVAHPTQQHATSGFRQLKASDWQPAKAIFDADAEILDWVLAPLSDPQRAAFQSLKPNGDAAGHGRSQCKSLDCSIMELADDIAYSVHDLEDAIVLGIVQRARWQAQVVEPLLASHSPFSKTQLDRLSEDLFCPEHYRRKDAIGTLVNALITSVTLAAQPQGEGQPLLARIARLQPDHHSLLKVLKAFVYTDVIRKPEVQLLEFKGQQMVMELFEAFASDPERLLPSSTGQRWREQIQQGHSGNRVIADYLSGMTDEFAARLHENLFTPRSGNLFELQSRL
ncbi:deoxyguanosinetriphosphate triphosphohydrolase [Ferrimonas balearica DSM 9799]|uniref:Deoxyguanosinetriphosphate triphosphohydrolase-like protein n=1 Tax=Ferrimonas balearica (strain DSM 9799 / CCM 4581 / KCTC 23876 / PAT) TaxID=550540 RepID=E1SM59_FERBD|nr:anti-phage deoxyguanosine triphosphatase [Ferrimonas balearica]ADN76577.1 deoxyguanosinetriphosphate triphosphohydrolase [Ferrimonas balearica DSM 9799]